MLGTLRPATRFDLHMHSLRSDGKFSVDEVLRRCAAGGLEVVSLTDHDLATPLPAGVHEIDGHRLVLIPGAEVSATHDGHEYHLLVYFPGDIPQGFRSFCAEQCQERAERYRAAVRSLGLPDLPPPDEGALQGHRALTRHHLARALIAGGHARDLRDAFSRFLSSGHGHVPSLSLPMVEAIAVARAFGGLTSWAHPPVPAVKAYLPELAKAGLQGLEALRPFVSGKDRATLRKLAKRHGLFLTGGSDWHGWSEPDLGLFRVEAREISDFVDALQAA